MNTLICAVCLNVFEDPFECGQEQCQETRCKTCLWKDHGCSAGWKKSNHHIYDILEGAKFRCPISASCGIYMRYQEYLLHREDCLANHSQFVQTEPILELGEICGKCENIEQEFRKLNEEIADRWNREERLHNKICGLKRDNEANIKEHKELQRILMSDVLCKLRELERDLSSSYHLANDTLTMQRV